MSANARGESIKGSIGVCSTPPRPALLWTDVAIAHEASIIVDLVLGNEVPGENTACTGAVLAGSVAQTAVQAKVACRRILVLLRALEGLFLDIWQRTLRGLDSRLWKLVEILQGLRSRFGWLLGLDW